MKTGFTVGQIYGKLGMSVKFITRRGGGRLFHDFGPKPVSAGAGAGARKSGAPQSPVPAAKRGCARIPLLITNCIRG
jgi:hypothetical protein